MKKLMVIVLVVLSGLAFVMPAASQTEKQSSIRANAGPNSNSDETTKSAKSLYRIIYDPKLLAYLQSILDQFLPNTPQYFRQIQFQLEIMNQPDQGGMSFADSSVFMDRTFVCTAASEDLVAFIMAHEMAHVASGHPADRDEYLKKPNADFQSDEFRRYCLQQEIEADLLAVRIVTAAGYDAARAADDLFIKLAPDAYHPDPAVRIAYIKQEKLLWEKIRPDWKTAIHLKPELVPQRCALPMV